MGRIVVQGGSPLRGSVKVSGAKNAVLPIMAASLLAAGESMICGLPWLADVNTFCRLLAGLGVRCTRLVSERCLLLDCRELESLEAPYEYVRRLRASFLVAGPLLAREKYVRIALPGGCAIGSRPVELHLKGLAAMGAQVQIEHGWVEARADRLQGTSIYLDFPSVGATENIMMAAVLARGVTTIDNAASEPEIVDLGNFLNVMGARVTGMGTRVIRIEGVESLHPAAHTVIPDRIEAGTFMVAAALTGGEVRVENVIPEHMAAVTAKLREVGVHVEEAPAAIRVRGNGHLAACDIKTLPYPGFPTDMQPQFAVLLSLARGTSVITETVFESRFAYLDELKRMGANLRVEGRTAVVRGVRKLQGAQVKAGDLRAGAAMVLAGLAAHGQTEIGCIHHIDRGYEDLVGKLAGLGASIWREDDL
ncbi:MAG: UDP-N-acetylglucosamine 1-carboxyvinyltransferase [Clostridia bacterium]|nr:MAG: UDP-N-acetylglucosamine 1-carboxyvinyltransferase [Clostridia bacterium]